MFLYIYSAYYVKILGSIPHKMKEIRDAEKQAKNGQNHEIGSTLHTERSGTQLFGYFYITQGIKANHRKK